MSWFSFAVSVIRNVSNCVTELCDVVDKYSRNSPIYAYGVTFTNIYTLFYFDNSFEEIRVIFDHYNENANRKTFDGRDGQLIVNCLLHINKNLLFVKKMSQYSKKEIGAGISCDLMDYQSLILRLYAVQSMTQLLLETIGDDFAKSIQINFNNMDKIISKICDDLDDLSDIEIRKTNVKKLHIHEELVDGIKSISQRTRDTLKLKEFIDDLTEKVRENQLLTGLTYQDAFGNIDLDEKLSFYNFTIKCKITEQPVVKSKVTKEGDSN